MIDKTKEQRIQKCQEPYFLVVLWQIIAYSHYYYQFDIYLGRHAILAIAIYIYSVSKTTF